MSDYAQLLTSVPEPAVQATETQGPASVAPAVVKAAEPPYRRTLAWAMSLILDTIAYRYGHWIDLDDLMPNLRKGGPTWEPESKEFMVLVSEEGEIRVTGATFYAPRDGEAYWKEKITEEKLTDVRFWLKPRGGLNKTRAEDQSGEFTEALFCREGERT